MDLKERVYSVLLISSSAKFNTSFEPFITGMHFDPPCVVTTEAAAKRTLSERSFDLIIINSPLTDESGLRLAIDAAAKSAAVVMVFIRSDAYSQMLPQMISQGVYLLPKQTSAQIIRQSLDWLITTRERLRRFEKKESTLADKMSEIRLVNRAKWALISERGMTEDEAHHYIEKQAMNQCVTRKAIAEQILNKA